MARRPLCAEASRTTRPHFSVSSARCSASCCERAAERAGAHRGEALLHRRVGEDLVRDAVHARHDRGRRALGREQREPGRRQQARLAELGGRRHVGQRRRALRRHHRDRAHLAALHLAGDAGDQLEHELDVAGDQVGRRGARRVVGHVDHLRAGLAHEELARQVHRAADAGRAEVELAGVRLGVALELGEVLGRDVVVDDEDVGHVGDEQDRHEVLLRVEAQVLVERLVHRQRAGPAEQEVVAVARRRWRPR